MDYYVPASIDEAIALMTELGDGANGLAGGQSLIPAMRFLAFRYAGDAR